MNFLTIPLYYITNSLFYLLSIVLTIFFLQSLTPLDTNNDPVQAPRTKILENPILTSTIQGLKQKRAASAQSTPPIIAYYMCCCQVRPNKGCRQHDERTEKVMVVYYKTNHWFLYVWPVVRILILGCVEKLYSYT